MAIRTPSLRGIVGNGLESETQILFTASQSFGRGIHSIQQAAGVELGL